MDNLQNISVLAHELSDLELALLICLGGREHCLIEATEGNIHDVAAELALICSHTYGLRYAVVEFSGTTSLEDFHDQVCTHSRSEPGTVADVVIAKNFDYASERIQLEAVELMRSRKLTTSSGVREAPTHFLFVPVIVHDLSQVRPKLNVHLVSLLWQLVMLSNAPRTTLSSYPTFTTLKAEALHDASKTVTTTAELVQYQQDIVVFLRLSRAVAGGISARSSIQFAKLAK
ncbi:hypothetical protein AN6910.2 [Aspergillus nidulans FGSC A4]|nr:hypothetical protein AN6910.2 [Aspergillus nidulans FGSC A4]|eukprot:XP_664514.1 hypothetical protein AN6910.2 [Aspergillus nidulans FGSC A4]